MYHQGQGTIRRLSQIYRNIVNDTLLVGPSVHPHLIDMLVKFHMNCITLMADVSKRFRAIKLKPSYRDIHCFVWHTAPGEPLKDFHMTHATFGVLTSCFPANMAVKQLS